MEFYERIFPSAPAWALYTLTKLIDGAEAARQARDQRASMRFSEAVSRIFTLLELHERDGILDIERVISELVETLTGYLL